MAGEPVAAAGGPAPRFRLRLMFEWGGGSLWCGDQAALDAFGVGHVEDALPLSAETLGRLEELSAWHDTSLDWDDPAGPGPWTPGEYEDFERAAAEVLEIVRAELGPDFRVDYRRM